MKRPIYSALFVLSFVLASPNLGVSQQQDSRGSVNPATQTAGGSGPATIVGQEVGRDKGQPAGQTGPSEPATGVWGDGVFRRTQPAAQSGLSGPVQAKAATPAQTNALDPRQVILAAKTVAVVGMVAVKAGCSLPLCPSAKRAKERTEESLRKWGRFTLVEDQTKADLVVVAMESDNIDGETWAQLRVFKGPVTPAFAAQVRKRLSAQLRHYEGAGPIGERMRATVGGLEE